MIETMNERHEHFVSEMQSLVYCMRSTPSLPIPRFKSSLYDDYESSFSRKSNVVDDAPLIDLEEVFDPPLTSSSLVASSLSSTPVATSVNNSTFLVSPLRLS